LGAGLKVIQICHDYEGPFQAICRQYNAAFENAHVTTLYLRGKPDEDVVLRTGGNEVVFLDQGKGALSGIKWTTIFQVYRLFRRSSFDLAIAHRYKSIYLAGLMSYFFHLNLVLAVAHEHKVFKRITRSLFLTFWRKQIVVLGVSASVTQDVESYCPGLKEQGRLYTLNNAIDMNQKARLKSRAEAREQLGLHPNDFLLGTVGRLVVKKNHTLLLNAFAKSEVPDGAKLLLIGSGPEEMSLRKLANKLSIEDQLVFLGHVPEAYRYLPALDVFVFSSGEAEAFGIVLLEAMLAETPLISSNASGPAEVVRDTGWLFDLDSVDDLSKVISKIVSMPENDRRARSASALARVETEYSDKRFRKNLWGLKPMMELGQPERVSSS
tara:strand:- start:829 stop:1971 length:1143 start_codon:yes stop_codon:yes gene_type:complete